MRGEACAGGWGCVRSEVHVGGRGPDSGSHGAVGLGVLGLVRFPVGPGSPAISRAGSLVTL